MVCKMCSREGRINTGELVWKTLNTEKAITQLNAAVRIKNNKSLTRPSTNVKVKENILQLVQESFFVFFNITFPTVLYTGFTYADSSQIVSPSL